MAAAVLGIPEKQHMISLMIWSCVMLSSRDLMTLAMLWGALWMSADLKLNPVWKLPSLTHCSHSAHADLSLPSQMQILPKVFTNPVVLAIVLRTFAWSWLAWKCWWEICHLVDSDCQWQILLHNHLLWACLWWWLQWWMSVATRWRVLWLLWLPWMLGCWGQPCLSSIWLRSQLDTCWLLVLGILLLLLLGMLLLLFLMFLSLLLLTGQIWWKVMPGLPQGTTSCVWRLSIAGGRGLQYECTTAGCMFLTLQCLQKTFLFLQ